MRLEIASTVKYGCMSYHDEFEVLVKVKGSKRQKVSEVTLSAPEVYCWLAAGPPR